jgi:hypothetical protein
MSDHTELPSDWPHSEDVSKLSNNGVLLLESYLFYKLAFWQQSNNTAGGKNFFCVGDGYLYLGACVF